MSAEADGSYAGGNSSQPGEPSFTALELCDLGRKLTLSDSSSVRWGESYLLKASLRELKEKTCSLPLSLSLAGSLLRDATIY